MQVLDPQHRDYLQGVCKEWSGLVQGLVCSTHKLMGACMGRQATAEEALRQAGQADLPLLSAQILATLSANM